MKSVSYFCGACSLTKENILTVTITSFHHWNAFQIVYRQLLKAKKIRPRGYKTFFMLNSTEHDFSCS